MKPRETTPALSRRSFLKSTAMTAGAVGAAGLLGACTEPKLATLEDDPAALSQTGTEEIVLSGACRGGCAQGCYINYHVRDGKVVRTSARDFVDPDYNRICAKGLSLPERIYNPDRVKFPMRRVGERGSGQWEQISWEEAIEQISESVLRNTKEYGPLAVGHTFRTGQEGIVFQMVWNRFRKALGRPPLRQGPHRFHRLRRPGLHQR